MDINQAAKMIEWLDEERRRDKAVIATLQERLAHQQEQTETLLRRLNAVEADNARLQGQVATSARDLDLIEQMRREMTTQIEQIEAKRLTAEREADRRVSLAVDNATRPMREMMDKLGKLERQTTELPAINVERDRLAAAVAALQQRVDDLIKRLEEPDRRLTFLEEQRRQDARRLADAEAELPELRKTLETVKPKLTLLEDLALRNERRITEVINGDHSRREQIQQFIDQQTLLEQQRETQMAALQARFASSEQQMQQNAQRFETWAEAYREMKKILDDFDRISDRLERRINEVAETQRLSEERFRQEWNDWRGDDQKRWKNLTASSDEVWRQHDKEFERFVQRFSELERFLPPLQESINRLWALERDRARLYREQYQALIMQHDDGTNVSVLHLPKMNGSSGG
jgi:chromosome segregation ATPase